MRPSSTVAPAGGDRSRGRRSAAGPGILIIAASHGFPPTQARLARVIELSRGFACREAPIDVILLVERTLLPFEEDMVRGLAASVREARLVFHPELRTPLSRALGRLRGVILGRPRLGGASHSPRSLLRSLRRACLAREYRAVIVSGLHLARALSVVDRDTDRILDLTRIESDAHTDHERLGRADALGVPVSVEEERALIERARMVIVTSTEDAIRLRQMGVQRDSLVVPPTGILGAIPPPEAASAFPPERPPRVLCVASGTTANLDGLRWFRRQVYPRILRAVPTCRLRLVGRAASDIEPGPGIDRIGWVERLDVEYRRAAVVALPLRMGSGVHRRAVEAIAWGRPLVTTTRGAHGTGLVPGRDAVISDIEEGLATGTAELLANDGLRREREDRALEVWRERFHPGRTFGMLAMALGLSAHAAGAAEDAATPEAAVLEP
jgi:glycosyltransferase involved in cell wall biosynthesis